ncbi:hypothetical protein E3N88_13997 [Mikania micrantha]|uniref:Reverse transcriptase Ty1/copia-type domain-containing protein n=1 Tax=Mikania micrantha TaxID=192012 RepID=A0A5N6P1G4_9ASTR|nr:hypothetical protein E3N88_13997 [Mikania micrantha]
MEDPGCEASQAIRPSKISHKTQPSYLEEDRFHDTPIKGFKVVVEVYPKASHRVGNYDENELLLATNEPLRYSQAVGNPNREDAMKMEIESIERNRTWILTSLPKMPNPLDLNGPHEGCPSTACFSSSLWVDGASLDMKSTFLHEYLKEGVYVVQLEDCVYKGQFDLSDLGPLAYYLGIEVQQCQVGLEEFSSEKSKCQGHFDVYKECKKKEFTDVATSTVQQVVEAVNKDNEDVNAEAEGQVADSVSSDDDYDDDNDDDADSHGGTVIIRQSLSKRPYSNIISDAQKEEAAEMKRKISDDNDSAYVMRFYGTSKLVV